MHEKDPDEESTEADPEVLDPETPADDPPFQPFAAYDEQESATFPDPSQPPGISTAQRDLEEISETQAQLQGILDDLHERHRGNRGPKPIYRMRVERIKPYERAGIFPDEEIDITQPLDLTEIGRRYKGGTYDVTITKGNRIVPDGKRKGLRFPEEAFGYPQDSPSVRSGDPHRHPYQPPVPQQPVLDPNAFVEAMREAIGGVQEVVREGQEQILAVVLEALKAKQGGNALGEIGILVQQIKAIKEANDLVNPPAKEVAPSVTEQDIAGAASLLRLVLENGPSFLKAAKDILKGDDAKAIHLHPVKTENAE